LCADTLGNQHPSYGLFLENFADLLWREGQSQAAVKTYEKAIAVLAARLGPDHPDLAELRNRLASVRKMRGRDSGWTIDVSELRASARP